MFRDRKMFYLVRSKRKLFLSLFLCFFLLSLMIININGGLGLSVKTLLHETSDNSLISAATTNNTDNQLLQNMLDVINSKSSPEEMFQYLNEEQLNGLTLAELSQYLQYMRRSVDYKYSSFYKLSERDRQSIESDILNNQPAYKEYLSKLDFYFFESDSVPMTKENDLSSSESSKKMISVTDDVIRKNNGESNISDSTDSNVIDSDGVKNKNESIRILLALERRDDNTYVLPTKYIRDTIDLYSYANLYFSAIRNKDTSTLKQLLFSESNDESILEKKATETVEYYKETVSGNFSSYKISVFRPEAICFLQNLNGSEAKEQGLSDELPYGLSDNENTDQKNFSESDELKTNKERKVWILRKDNKVLVKDPIDVSSNLFQKIYRNDVYFDISKIKDELNNFVTDDKQIHLGLNINSELDASYIQKLKEAGIEAFDYYQGLNYRLATVKFESGETELLFFALYKEKSTDDFVYAKSIFDMDRDEILKTAPFLDVNNDQTDLGSGLRLKFNFTDDGKLLYTNYFTDSWVNYGDLFNSLFAYMN